MTEHQLWVTAVAVWVVGLFTAWCLGYATRNRQDRAGHSRPVGQLARAHPERAAAHVELDDLEHARLHWEAHRAPVPAPVAVHVHLAAPLPWLAHPAPLPLDAPRFHDAMPVLPAEEVQS